MRRPDLAGVRKSRLGWRRRRSRWRHRRIRDPHNATHRPNALPRELLPSARCITRLPRPRGAPWHGVRPLSGDVRTARRPLREARVLRFLHQHPRRGSRFARSVGVARVRPKHGLRDPRCITDGARGIIGRRSPPGFRRRRRSGVRTERRAHAAPCALAHLQPLHPRVRCEQSRFSEEPARRSRHERALGRLRGWEASRHEHLHGAVLSSHR